MAWNNAIRLKINSEEVDSNLTDFPVLVYLSDSSGITNFDTTSIFDELGSNSKKIKIETENQQQCYVEIELWDNSNNKAWLWVKVPSVSSTTDTKLTLYYDASEADNDTYVGVTGDTAAQNVWDEDFVGVWHLSQTPAGAGSILDSTDYTNNGQSYNMGVSNVVTVGQKKGLDFNGTDEHIAFASKTEHQITGDLTIEAIQGLRDPVSATTRTVALGGYGETEAANFLYSTHRVQPDLDIGIFWEYGSGSNSSSYTTGGPYVAAGNTYGMVQVKDASAKTIDNYVDGVMKEQVGYANNPTGGSSANLSFAAHDQMGNPSSYSDITMSEVRISDIKRPAEWIKATYHSNFDTLITFSTKLLQIVHNDQWKDVSLVKLCINNEWKDISEIKTVIDNQWKTIQ